MTTISIVSSQAFSLVNFRGSLISALVRENFLVYALAPDYDDELRQQIVELGAEPVDFRLARTGMSPWRDVLDMLSLAIVLRRLRPNISLGYFIKPVIYGTLAAWMVGVPRRVALIEGLGYVYTSTGKSFPWKRRVLRSAVSGLYRIALARAHCVVFLNVDDRSEFVDGGLVESARAVNLGAIGVDLRAWSPVSVVTKPVTFLLIGRLLREKGIIEFAEAARLVKLSEPGARFVLLGGLDTNPSGLGKVQVETWVKEKLLEWPGHEAVKPWLAQASVFVLPSYREGVPRSTQEAMAMGLAVITTDVPGCRDTVVDGVNGFLVPVRDATALADAMMRFVNSPELIASMGRESRRLAVERFDARRSDRQLLWYLRGGPAGP